MNPYVRPSVWTDVEFLSVNMRKADVEEVAAVGRSPLDALSDGFNSSSICLTIIAPHSGQPMAMLGVVPTGGPLGAIWMLGTDEVTKESRAFLRYSKPVLQELFATAGFLGFFNAVHKANRVHVRWLQWMGFRFIREIDISGHTFIEFVKLKG